MASDQDMLWSRDMLSAQASAVWIGVLAAVLLFHCFHMVHMRGESRWYHGTHVAMLLGMIYMFASAAFGARWLPTAVWIVVYAMTTAAVVWWIFARRRRRYPYGVLWLLALAQQAAMIYMWLPMSNWVPWLSYALAAYFGLEMLGWLGKGVADAPAGPHDALAVGLDPKSVLNDLCMTAMAASMGYMFFGMQLMMTPSHSPSPAVAETSAGRPERRPQPPRGEARSARVGASSSIPETHVIAAGDTLRGLAARFYGDERAWREIVAANPGLDPRRLPVGRIIRLPPRRGETGAREGLNPS